MMNRDQEYAINIREQLKIFRRIVYVILILCLIMLLVMIFGRMDDEVIGTGTVAGIREYDLKTLVSAKTTRIFRYEGEFVESGEPLLEFDARNQHEVIAGLANQLKELELQLAVKEKETALLRKDPLPAYYRHTKNQLKEAEELFIRSQNQLKAYKKLYEQGAVSRREYLKVDTEHLANAMSLQRLQDDNRRIQSGMEAEILAKAEDELHLLRQKIAGKRDQLNMEKRHLEDYTLRAPDAGILTDIPPRPGGYYSKGDVVIRFAANQHKKVVGLVSEKQIFKVEPGQPVRITSEQYNYLDYGYYLGKVDVIYQLPVEIKGQHYYPVKIILTDEPQPLRFGSTCRISIITGRERILFALLGIRSQDYITRRKESFRKRKDQKKFLRNIPVRQQVITPAVQEKPTSAAGKKPQEKPVVKDGKKESPKK